MLVGRGEERLALDHLLGQARDGRSGVLAVVGEPGIGKSALLDYAAQSATGMRVLQARGIESEAEVPFAGLAELLRPVLGVLEQIPAPQARALAGALALGPSTSRDRFAIGAATLSLLSACAEESPVAVLIDDAHLLDGSSAGALLFASRRLIADPIAVVLAVREGEPSLLDGADLRVLRVGGLSQPAAIELLASDHVSREAVERLHRATGGNPLALLELASDAGQIASQPYGPVPISTSIAEAFLRRFGQLPETTRRLLVLTAASDGGESVLLARAGGALGLEIGELAGAEEAGLITINAAHVEFRHPLARSAVYAQASEAERREVHAALAGALPDRDLDRRAWHLAAAAIGPDVGGGLIGPRSRADAGRGVSPPRPPAARCEHARRAHPAGAADRAAAGRGQDDAGGRGGGVPQPEDRRVPPLPRLPEAGHPLPPRATRSAPDVTAC